VSKGEKVGGEAVSNDLGLIPLDDLIEELKRRGDAVIVAVERQKTSSDERLFNFHGGLAACIGLCEMMKYSLLDSRREIDGDEREF
jgi:hypothetical protein